MKSFNLPPNYFYLLIILSVAIKFIFPIGKFIEFPYILIGILVMFLGLFLIGWTYKLFVKNKTPENFSKSKAVVTEGPYRFSRNPMYIGAILFLIGLSILLGNYIAFICPIILFFILNEFARFEEKKMEKELGKKYLAYKKKVRRWI